MTRSVLRGLRAVALTGTLVLASGAAFAADPIKLGVLEDQSGDFAVATIGKVHAIQLAAEEINKAGGIAGRQIELVTYDTQSDNTRYQEFMRRVLQRDKVDVVFAGFSSRLARGVPSDRRPVQRLRVLQQPVRRRRLRRPHDRHRRGAGAAVLDPHSLYDGEVRQERLHASPPTTISARSRPNGSATSSRSTAARWSARSSSRSACRSSRKRIQNIQKAKPDFVVTLLVGTAQASYYEQAASANINLPMALVGQCRAGL